MVTVFVKAILCNWMVCLAIVLAMTTGSTLGKIACAWMPIFVFFAQGFEHSVVNMFVIPTGMMLGAKVSVADWWLWNQIPVTIGNLVGGFVFTGVALYLTHKPACRARGGRLARRSARRMSASSRCRGRRRHDALGKSCRGRSIAGVPREARRGRKLLELRPEAAS
jgi:hypothetical protein